jgi:hypothetical protein
MSLAVEHKSDVRGADSTGGQLVALPPGQGGQLRVTASAAWCGDARHILEVRQYPRPGSILTVIRLIAGPSACDWTFDGLPPGDYDATVFDRDSDQIVGNGYGRVSRGTTTLLTASALDTELEGRITSADPLPAPLRLSISVGGPYGEFNRWVAPVDADGSFRVAIGDVTVETLIFVRAQAASPDGDLTTPALHSVFLKTGRISRGVMRFDIENVKLPPCVVPIEIAPAGEAGFGDFGLLRVDDDFGEGFKLLRGFRGQALAARGPHTITVLTVDKQQVLASARTKPGADGCPAAVALQIR